MKISVLASTKPGFILPVKEALDFGGKSAAICYMPNTFEDILNEPVEKTKRRINQTLNSLHHSVYGHVQYNFYLEKVPKILAMILNNEKIYNTSEKSGRYTQMTPSKDEAVFYNKWLEILKKEIANKYPEFDESTITKKAQENARYMISVFTPATDLEYTTSFAQMNYILHWCQKYIEDCPNTEFNKLLIPVLKEFISEMSNIKELSDFKVDNLNDSPKKRTLSLFDSRQSRDEEFGETYTTTYTGTFTQLAQAQRHRTLSYHMRFLDKPEFYVPRIIQDNEVLKNDWLKDISSLASNFPQGMNISIIEQGTYENFILKCSERLCSNAQLEISIQTMQLLKKYIDKVNNPEIKAELQKYDYACRLCFSFPCNNLCQWRNSQLDRLV